MSGDIVLRGYHSGDEKQIVELLQLVFNGWPKLDLNCDPIDYWRWKFLDNPEKTSCVALGISEDKVIGVVEEFLLKIRIGNHVYLSSYGADVGVHPDYRRIGIFNNLLELVRQIRKGTGSRLGYLVTSNPMLFKVFSERQYLFPRTVLNLVKIRDIDEQLKAMPVEKAFLKRIGFKAVKFVNNLHNSVRGPVQLHKGIKIKEESIFDSRVDAFSKIVSEYHGFIVERDRDYLNWRYCDSRSGGFIVKLAEDDDGEILGYSVLRVNRYLDTYPIGYFVDLLALPGRFDVVEALTVDAVKYFDEQKTNIVNILVTAGHPYKKVLNKHGFLDSRIKLQIFISSATEILDELNKLETLPPDKMHFSFGDIDSLPVRIPGT